MGRNGAGKVKVVCVRVTQSKTREVANQVVVIDRLQEDNEKQKGRRK